MRRNPPRDGPCQAYRVFGRSVACRTPSRMPAVMPGNHAWLSGTIPSSHALGGRHPVHEETSHASVRRSISGLTRGSTDQPTEEGEHDV
jgi:hypothetical protein